MLEFKEIEIQDKEKCEKYLKHNKTYFCEHTFTDIFIWASNYNTKVAFTDEFMFLKAGKNYIAPIGKGNLEKALQIIKEDCTCPDCKLHSISEIMKEDMQKIGEYEFVENRDNFDYIYSSEKIITLSGKKLHSKRNFINRFMGEYNGMWEYENMTIENIDKVKEYHKKWIKQNLTDDLNKFDGENQAINKIFENFDALNMRGGVLKLNGEIIAFSMGCLGADDMFVIQIEKADSTIAGAYPMINQQFAIANCQDVKYINREEDMGIEGLRKAKLSYKPEFLAVKYEAKI